MDLVITPTLNEKDNIDILVTEVLSKPGFGLLVVDDDSTDGTWQRVQALQEDFKSLYLLHRKDNHGFRNSYVEGIKWALERELFERILTMDADLSHKPEYLQPMRNALEEGADMVIGSRYTLGGGIENWSFVRRTISATANRFARMVTRLPVSDCTAGFTGMTRALAAKLDLDSIQCEGYGFLIELKHKAWMAGASFAEVPIMFRDREHGTTKFNSSMISEAARTCLRLRKQGPAAR